MIQDDIKLIANHFGYENQSIKCIEKLSELSTAICKHQLNNYDSTSVIYENLIEELADSSLMIEQMIHLLDSEDKVAQIKQYKVERTLKKIAETMGAKLEELLENEERRFKEG